VTEAPAQAGNQTFDIVILGAGSGGYAAALRASELNLSVALIEKDKLGGTCLHRGCIPTKALLHAGEVADSAREAAQFGVDATLNGVSMPGVNTYKDGVVNRLYKGLQGLVKSRGVTQVAGSGRLVGPKSVQVGDSTFVATKAVILATGSYPRSLPGLEIGGRVITSEQGLELEWIPRKVVVLGGGVIGVEFASAWRSFGAEVVIVEALDRLLPLDDEASSKALERAYRRRDIEFRTGVRFSGVTQNDAGVQVSLEDGTLIDADLLLVAVGRGPNSKDNGFEEQGIEFEGPFVKVDERLRTNIPGIYAVGDLTPWPQLAHAGFQEGIFVAEDIAGLNPAVIDPAGIPRVTYSEPEVASVGLTEAQARDKYGAEGIDTFTYDLAGNGKSQILKTAGFVKLVRAKDGPVVGVHMVGSRVGELLAEAQLIYGWEAQPEDVAPLIHAHPTMSEAVGEAHLALAGKPLHVHG
jgi:dihydrolipoamide dehydrogenase